MLQACVMARCPAEFDLCKSIPVPWRSQATAALYGVREQHWQTRQRETPANILTAAGEAASCKPHICRCNEQHGATGFVVRVSVVSKRFPAFGAFGAFATLAWRRRAGTTRLGAEDPPKRGRRKSANQLGLARLRAELEDKLPRLSGKPASGCTLETRWKPTCRAGSLRHCRASYKILPQCGHQIRHSDQLADLSMVDPCRNWSTCTRCNAISRT